MNTFNNDKAFVFIVGSPRSGTTILGNILDCHQKVSQWFEPYFVWDHYFRHYPHDERNEKEMTPRIKHQIYSAFLKFKKKTGSKIIVDKSPRNSLKIPFILEIFPHARFIHILRDGRDATLSIHKEWDRIKRIVHTPNQKFAYVKDLPGIINWLRKQPFFLDKMKSLWFETHYNFIDNSKHLNKLRWNGNIGWGPRFKHWEEFFNKCSLLQFNAYQWLNCVENVNKNWSKIPNGNKIEIKYEDLLKKEGKIKEIIGFLGVKTDDHFLHSIPELKRDNYNKWQKELLREQANSLVHILTPMLIKLGYETNYEWPLRISSCQR